MNCYINLDYLDMMTGGDADMRDTMISMLLEELPTEMEKMRYCHDAEDWVELREVSHKMKSTLAFIGNDAMTEANQQIEKITKTGGNTANLPDLLNTLESNLPGVLDELRESTHALFV